MYKPGDLVRLNAAALNEPKTFPGLSKDTILTVKDHIGYVVFLDREGPYCTKLNECWLEPYEPGDVIADKP